MGCVPKLPKVIKKKRRTLEIFLSQQLEAEETDEDDNKCVTVDLSNDKESSSEEDITDFNCLICDRLCTSFDDLESHKKIHSVDKTSSLILTVERDIFNNILEEESDPVSETSANLSESLLDNYDELLENLISSISPDELLEKISITNEIPDDYSVMKQSVVKASVTNQEPTHKNECSKSVFQAKNKGQKRSLAGKTEDKRKDAKRLKSELFSAEEVEFHNKLNGKIFKVLSKDSEGFTRREVETESLRFSLTTPIPSLAPDDQPHPHRTFPAVCSTSNKSFEARMENGERLCQAVRKGKTVKKKMKRGTVGYLLNMEFDYSNIEEKEEDEEDEDLLSQSGRSSAESVEPSSQPNIATEAEAKAEVEMPPEVLAEETESEELLPSMPVFDI